MRTLSRKLFTLDARCGAAVVVALLAACSVGSEESAPGPGPAPAPAPGPGPAPGPAPSPAPTPTPPPAPTPPPLARTEAGLPEGLPVSATIGAAGGTLSSSDGRLTVTVPAGALAADTAVGIQPITATAPGALGSGYRLTPEGVNFAQPVTLTFNYSADEAGASIPESLRVATRDSRGYWRVISTARDAAQRKLAVTITHFSDWSHVAGLQLLPASATVEVNKTKLLRVIDCSDGPDPDSGNSQQRLLFECIEEELPQLARNWSVNAIAGGNSTVGTVAGGSQGTYHAPAVVPAQNPVAVSAQIDTAAGLTTLVSNIKVVDKLTVYEGTIFGRTDYTSDGRQVSLSANLRFTYNPDLSVGGTKHYGGTGTAFVRGLPRFSTGCTEGSGAGPVEAATLALHTEGPQAGTYSIASLARVSVTITCNGTPQTLTLQGVAGAGGDENCPFPQIGNDPGRLAGSFSCNYPQLGTRHVANWTLRAVE